jgi:hypothetical protein
MVPEISTEDLNVARCVCDALADHTQRDTLEGLVLAAAAEILRRAVRARTIHDPIPGQLDVC